jgi:peptide/nickel transport system substrate-binding protein
MDEVQRKELYKNLGQALREEVPCISLFFRDAAVVVRNKVKGDIKPDAMNPYRNIHQWYIPESKQQ